MGIGSICEVLADSTFRSYQQYLSRANSLPLLSFPTTKKKRDNQASNREFGHQETTPLSPLGLEPLASPLRPRAPKAQCPVLSSYPLYPFYSQLSSHPLVGSDNMVSYIRCLNRATKDVLRFYTTYGPKAVIRFIYTYLIHLLMAFCSLRVSFNLVFHARSELRQSGLRGIRRTGSSLRSSISRLH